MANLTAIRWEKWAPAIGKNLKLPLHEQLRFNIGVGLSTTQLQELTASQVVERPEPPADETPEQRKSRLDAEWKAHLDRLAAGLSPYAKLLGTHTIDGKTINSLRDYLEAVPYHVAVDVMRVVLRWNSLSGGDELFSARSSGGAPTTDDPEEAE